MLYEITLGDHKNIKLVFYMLPLCAYPSLEALLFKGKKNAERKQS